MAQVLSLMATHSSDKITVQALKMIENEIPAGALNKSRGLTGAPNKRCRHTHRFSKQKMQMSSPHTFMQRNACTWEILWLIHGI